MYVGLASVFKREREEKQNLARENWSFKISFAQFQEIWEFPVEIHPPIWFISRFKV